MDLHWKFPYRILYPLVSSRKFHDCPVKSKAYQQYLIALSYTGINGRRMKLQRG